MAAETNVIKAEDLKKAREIDFTQQFTHGDLTALIEVLGVTRKIPMMEGTTLRVYKITGTPESGNVAEGDIIPLSKFEQEPVDVGPITLKKWRKAATAEAIAKSGYDVAVSETDAALMREVEKGVRKDLFDFLNGTIDNSATASGNGLQAALADSWGQLQVKFEDDSVEPVHFLNPMDVSKYLATANISTQTAFGMNYIRDFLGLGTVIMTSHITQGTFVSTAKQNLIMYYITIGGDVARAFNLTFDELGIVGINSGGANTERAQIETLVMSGVKFLVEYAEGVVKGTISGE